MYSLQCISISYQGGNKNGEVNLYIRKDCIMTSLALFINGKLVRKSTWVIQHYMLIAYDL